MPVDVHENNCEVIRMVIYLQFKDTSKASFDKKQNVILLVRLKGSRAIMQDFF